MLYGTLCTSPAVQIGLSTYHSIVHNDHRNPQQKEQKLPLQGFPLLYISIFLNPKPCHLGLGSHPSLNFKGKLFHKWSALVWENPKQSQRGEVSEVCFSMCCVVSFASVFDLLNHSKDILSLTIVGRFSIPFSLT